MKRILVGVDGSPESETAAQKAVELAKALGAQLTIAYVVSPRPPSVAETYAAEVQRADVLERDYVAALLFQAELRCRNQGVNAETVSLSGPVAETLADLAPEYDVVVVGHRGRGAVSRALLGSVADRLVQICPKPVLVVR
ncbi:MAG TPA: universal stress protein [Myxococcales bacterium]|nr:universal stress protein [Myxococcales bacterium]